MLTIKDIRYWDTKTALTCFFLGITHSFAIVGNFVIVTSVILILYLHIYARVVTSVRSDRINLAMALVCFALKTRKFLAHMTSVWGSPRPVFPGSRLSLRTSHWASLGCYLEPQNSVAKPAVFTTASGLCVRSFWRVAVVQFPNSAFSGSCTGPTWLPFTWSPNLALLQTVFIVWLSLREVHSKAADPLLMKAKVHIFKTILVSILSNKFWSNLWLSFTKIRLFIERCSLNAVTFSLTR